MGKFIDAQSNRENAPIGPTGKATHCNLTYRESTPILPIGETLQSGQSGKHSNRANRESLPIGPVGKAYQAGQSETHSNQEGLASGANHQIRFWMENARVRIGYQMPIARQSGKRPTARLRKSIGRDLASGTRLDQWASLLWLGHKWQAWRSPAIAWAIICDRLWTLAITWAINW